MTTVQAHHESAFQLPNPMPARPAPILKKVATMTVTLGTSLGTVEIPGGVSEINPIASGTVSGLFSGHIIGGVADRNVFVETDTQGHSEVVKRPLIVAYGKTDDDHPFFFQAVGDGSATKCETRMALTIGGKYADLSNEFLLASITPVPYLTPVQRCAFDVYKVE